VTKQSWLNLARVVFATSSIVAMIYHLTHSTNSAVDRRVTSFFSFCTIGVVRYSIAIVVAIAAFSWVIVALSKRQPDPSFVPA